VLAAGSAHAGAPGAGFGARGEITTTFSLKSDDTADALALQPNGKVVVGGYSTAGPHGSDFDFALARYSAGGKLDPGFGSGGKVLTVFGGGSSVSALGLQPDGKIVAAGSVLVNRPDFDVALARYNPDGTLDPSFGSGGMVTTTFGPTADLMYAVVLQPDGKIVVAGGSGLIQQRDDVFALARYRPDGTLDPTFGSGGKVTTTFGPTSDDFVQALALQPDGKIVAAGVDFVAGRVGPSDFALARYRPDGSLDPTFGSGGKVTTDFASASDFGNALLLQPDGKIVVAGYSFQGTVGPSSFALARYDTEGKLDPTFGSGGEVTTDLGPAGTAWAVALQPDGKIVAAGSGRPGIFALARYNPNGTLDPAFGSGGKLTTAFGPRDEGQASALVLQPDGKMVAAGWSNTCTYGDFALARYRPDGSLDSSFGSRVKRCVVPNVKGRTLAAAKREVKRRDCSVGPVGRVFSRTVKAGRVVSQFPRPGTECAAGAKVVLSVSKGKRRPR